MRCPICGTKCVDSRKCLECGFDQLDVTFLNKQDAKKWRLEVVEPKYQQYWLKRGFFVEKGVLRQVFWEDFENKHVIEIPYGVKVIGSSAFFARNGIKEVQLPDTVKVIMSSAFVMCNDLVSINLPRGLLYIGRRAFWGCKIQKLQLPSGILQVEEGFCRCNASLTIDGSNDRYKIIDDCLIDLKNSTLIHCCSRKHQIVIPSIVKRIGEGAFDNDWENDQRIVLCDGLESVGTGNHGAELWVSGSVTNIEEDALSSFDKIVIDSENERYVSENNCVIDKRINRMISVADKNCITLRIPSGVNRIGSYAFRGCHRLGRVIVSGSIEYVEKDAFRGIGCDEYGAQVFFESENISNKWDQEWWSRGLGRVYWKGEWHWMPAFVADDWLQTYYAEKGISEI